MQSRRAVPSPHEAPQQAFPLGSPPFRRRAARRPFSGSVTSSSARPQASSQHPPAERAVSRRDGPGRVPPPSSSRPWRRLPRGCARRSSRAAWPGAVDDREAAAVLRHAADVRARGARPSYVLRHERASSAESRNPGARRRPPRLLGATAERELVVEQRSDVDHRSNRPRNAKSASTRSSESNSAATYSPGRLPSEYHRRRRA